MDNETTPIIVSIEGNIGSGKSTLLTELQNKYGEDTSICFIQEPVDVWNTVQDENGVSILEKYYADQKRYAFPFQMMAYISRISIIRDALKQNYKVIVLERSVFTDAAVFAKMLFDDKKIEEIEYKIYMKWINEFSKDIPPIKFIYLERIPKFPFSVFYNAADMARLFPSNIYKIVTNTMINGCCQIILTPCWY